jgi:integrase
VQTAGPGRWGDGGGLYLIIGKDGRRKSWVFRFTLGSRQSDMGLGGVRDVTLARARELAADARRLVAQGINPIAAARKRADAKAQTFGAVADALIEALRPGWRSARHAGHWSMTLKTYVPQSIRDKDVAAIDIEDVLAILQPLWTSRPETASRLRGRIERVLDSAKARGLRGSENPARWRGNLDHLLSRRQRIAQVHHAAMPFDEVPVFVARLRERIAVAARALEFVILTASRSGEARFAVPSEFDLTKALWTIPAARMKSGLEHVIPLSPRAVEIVSQMLLMGGAYVFPGQRLDRPLSMMTMVMLMRRMSETSTVHGFRSAFRDWCGEATNYPRELAEAALAHVVGNQVERAYRRGTAIEKRRQMMEAWALWCEPKPAGVVLFRKSDR